MIFLEDNGESFMHWRGREHIFQTASLMLKAYMNAKKRKWYFDTQKSCLKAVHRRQGETCCIWKHYFCYYKPFAIPQGSMISRCFWKSLQSGGTFWVTRLHVRTSARGRGIHSSPFGNPRCPSPVFKYRVGLWDFGGGFVLWVLLPSPTKWMMVDQQSTPSMWLMLKTHVTRQRHGINCPLDETVSWSQNTEWEDGW